MAARTPNILLIMSDEHDPAVSGCYGDPVVRTPHLDRLAAEGVTFDAAYTTSPLCVPARLSFTAGKYVSRCGAWSNNNRLAADDIPSLPRVLSAAGTEPCLCGKMHYDRTRRYGFHDIFPEDKSNNHHKTGRGGHRAADDQTRNRESWEGRTAQFFVGDEEESPVMTADQRRVERTCAFLRDRGRDEKPFFLTLGLISPHFPLIAPQAYHDLYKDRVPLPELPDDWFERLPLNYKHLIWGFGVDPEDRDILKKGRELYWALVSWMDTEIGKVLDALEDAGLAEDTVVIYTSDHGENKGDHGLWWKNNMFEHSARVPLIVRWPGRWAGGQRRAGACSLVDLTQTIADLAGAETPADWDGDSLLPLLDDAEAPWKDRAVCEYYGHNIASGFAMLREGRYKYVYHARMDDDHGPERELYDLEADPGEWTNLAADPAHRERVEALHRTLVAELGRSPDEAEAECRADYALGYPDAVAATA